MAISGMNKKQVVEQLLHHYSLNILSSSFSPFFFVRNGLDLNDPGMVFVLLGIYEVCRPFFWTEFSSFPPKEETSKILRLFKEFLERVKMLCFISFCFQVCFDVFFSGRPHWHPIFISLCVLLWGGSIREEQNLSNWLVSYFCRAIPVFACGYWQSEVAAGVLFIGLC